MVYECDNGIDRWFKSLVGVKLINIITEILVQKIVTYQWTQICILSFTIRQFGGQKGLTGYCFKYIDRPFCLQADELHFEL